MAVGKGFCPRAMVTLKYSGKGGYSRRSLPMGVDERVASVLTEALNASKTKSSWGNHHTAIRHIAKAQEEYGVKMKIPFTQSMTCTYVAYLKGKGMQPETMKVYLSAVRAEHMIRGYCPDSLMPDWLGKFLDGAKKLRNQSGKKRERAPVTLNGLLKIREWIKKNVPGEGLRATVWLACSWLFWGSLRPQEVLCEAHDRFSLDRTLQKRDVKEGVVKNKDGKEMRCLFLKIKSPKEAKGLDQEIELIENQSKTCPWKAWEFWKRTRASRVKEFEPIMRKPDGSLVIAKDIQGLLDGALGADLKRGEFLSTHSFRAGMATELAMMGVEDEEIMRQGRWHSGAFLNYVKLGRKNRAVRQIALARKVTRKSG